MQRCEVCQKETDQCCSLCRNAFYCSPQHQEVDWHSRHKLHCAGKQNIKSPPPNEDFQIGSQVSKSLPNVSHVDQQAKMFVGVFEERLVLRRKVVESFSAGPMKQLVKDCGRLVEISEKATELYESSICDTLLETYGIEANDFIVRMDGCLDKTMLARCYLKAGIGKDLKELLLKISEEVEDYPSFMEARNSSSFKKMLSAVIDIAEEVHYDKVVEKMYAHFIKLVERFDGIWEQIYAYFSMGVWYARKTYYQKAVKCFSYTLELMASHKISKEESALILKADVLFNQAQCRRASGESKAIENMQESYKLRSQCVGKNSLETSDCLYWLGQWCREDEDFEGSLQYVQECFRIRKLNALGHESGLEQIKELVKKIYQQINQKKEKNPLSPTCYFERLPEGGEAPEKEEKKSFTKRLLQDQRDYVTFRVNITPELASTFTSQQYSHVGDLIELVDTRMLKEEAVRQLLESQFSQSLNEDQRDIFIRLNKIT